MKLAMIFRRVYLRSKLLKYNVILKGRDLHLAVKRGLRPRLTAR